MKSFVTFTRKTAMYALLMAGVLSVITAGLLLASYSAAAQDTPNTTIAPSFHPTFALLDADGLNVLESSGPVSTMRTCGQCHDTAFIASHSGHADAGLSSMGAAGTMADGQPWQMSSGPFGGWDPITYRYLSPEGDARVDLTLPDWIRVYGERHVGGGPAAALADGTALTELDGSAADSATQIVDPQTGALVPWDWQESGSVEMNCFLCHTATPNNAVRVATLRAGAFRWASSATLVGSGIASAANDGVIWDADAFNADGTVRADLIRVQDPSDQNCGQCHGLVHSDARTPLALPEADRDQWMTLTTGQVYSPQRLSATGLNLKDKQALGRTWDIHAERVVGCTNCHYALNNPVYDTEADVTRPAHLQFDPRRMDFGEYLYRPLHQFANTGAQTVTQFGSAERTCASCHDAVSTHTWLPYAERHMAALNCETCHVPVLYAPALSYVDWTALHDDGSPLRGYRGVEADAGGEIISGFQPVVLPVATDSGARLTPHNLVSAWYWVYGDPARPVPLRDLQAAWLDGDNYHAAILAAFDEDGSGALDERETALDTDEKVSLIAGRLAALGLSNPRIAGETRPYAIHHNVTYGQWATGTCSTCHSEESRLNAPFTLAAYLPGGVEPTFIHDDATLSGTMGRDADGALFYQPDSSAPPTGLYVLGHDSVAWIDLLGMLMFLGVFAGVIAHGGLRYLAARRGAMHQPAATRQVYMYSVYERQWHWLQTVAIFGLLFTGLVIHRPLMFSMFDFRFVVLVHNALAVLLVINAALSAFYHLVSGEIRQYLPRPYGFFDQMFAQAKYYLRGIFQGAEHPFEKTPERKLNPLQQLTYLAILNVLLPAQIITGALMWGAQQWPDITAQLGGLGFLAPLHTLVAWLFASFIVMHVYLTTTGHTPMANIRAMMLGWDEVETRSHGQAGESVTGEGTAS